MKKNDKITIHETIKQQTISITKIHKLNKTITLKIF